MPQTKLHSITNRNLFSDDYLRSRLPKRSDWQYMAPYREPLEQVHEIYREAGVLLETANEEQIRREIIDKILEILNPYFLPNQSLPTGGVPDYIFFADVKAKQRKDLPAAISVADAKEPGRDFDKAPPRERSPVRQVYDYMIDTQTRWGILTDGRRWRLLNRDSPTDRYFEIDLYNIATKEDSEEWLYFYNLFRREAFISSLGKCFLDLVKEESVKYSQDVGDELKDRVYTALRELTQGFVEWPENGLDPRQEGVREKVRGCCFILLYRLLFIFYAEARVLLPKDLDGYRQISLENIRDRVRNASRNGSRFLSVSTGLWAELRNLFRLVDKGSAEMKISPYNGGLFSERGSLGPSEFLTKWEISDKYLARAIDMLGTAPSLEHSNEFVNVDYRSLEIRHLGSIYEGLLEYRLSHAERDLVSVRVGPGEIWVPLDEYSGKLQVTKVPVERRVKAGQLFLETQKHERKVTGSYYTPDKIVKYIVSQALNPIIEERRRSAAREGRSGSEAVLSIKVCDPAIGSGHFLVEATEVLGEALSKAFSDDQREGLLPAGEHDIMWARREVVSHCIYGVDLNPLAVELAKVGLWLSTVSRDRPLSFLDHRLKCGNSLIGGRLAELKDYPRLDEHDQEGTGHTEVPASISPIFVDKLIGKIKELEGLRDDRLEDIRRKEQIFEEFKRLPEYEKTRAVANVHTAIYFGNIPTKNQYTRLVLALHYGSNWKEATSGAWFNRAKLLAQGKRFFHWELEFPEIFFENGRVKDNPGFDVFIGNPPYVRIYRGQILEEDADYFTRVYESAHMKFDLYVLFVELGLDLLARGGRLSMILPDKWLFTPYGEPLRREVLSCHFQSLLDLRGLEIFPGVGVDNVIPVISKIQSQDADELEILRGETDPSGGLITTSLRRIKASTFGHIPGYQIRLEVSGDANSLLEKIKANSLPLERICYVNWGLRTGTEEKTREMIGVKRISPRHKPLIRGEDIEDRYSLLQVERFIDYNPQQMYNPMFPELFEKPKLVFRKISGRRGLMAVLDEGGRYGFSTVIIAVRHSDLDGVKRAGVIGPTLESKQYGDLRYLLGLVNSRLMRWYYEMLLSDQLSVVPNQVKELPIRSIAFTTPIDRRQELTQQGKELYNEYLQTSNLQAWHNYLNERLAPDKDETDVVHDLIALFSAEMASMHTEKWRYIHAFLNWVQSPVGLAVKIELNWRDFTSISLSDPTRPSRTCCRPWLIIKLIWTARNWRH